MKTVIIIIALAIAGGNSINAQSNKSVFFELGGNGLGLSLNFESRLAKSEKGFGLRGGIGLIPAINAGDADILIPSSPAVLTIPISINHLAGKAPSYLETGLGVTYAYTNGTFSSDFWGYSEKVQQGIFLLIPSVGYRYAKTGKGFMGRIVISPIIGSGGVTFWAGLSAGYKF